MKTIRYLHQRQAEILEAYEAEEAISNGHLHQATALSKQRSERDRPTNQLQIAYQVTISYVSKLNKEIAATYAELTKKAGRSISNAGRHGATCLLYTSDAADE